MNEQPRRVDGIELEEVAGGFMVHQPSRECVHYLNHTAAIVLELCDGKLNRDEIARALQQLYDLPSAPVAEVEECLGTLRQHHLIG
jgi:hypothetical protein